MYSSWNEPSKGKKPKLMIGEMQGVHISHETSGPLGRAPRLFSVMIDMVS